MTFHFRIDCKWNKLCLKADFNANYKQRVIICQHYWLKFHGVEPLVVDLWCPYIGQLKTLANQPWNYFRCITMYLITILQRHGHICQFCSMYGINDLESRLEVIWGRIDFSSNRKRVYDFLLDLNSNFGPCRVSINIRASVHRKPLFWYPSPIPAKISGCSPWSRSVMLGSAKNEHPRLTNSDNIFSKNSNLWSRYIRHEQTDRRLPIRRNPIRRNYG